MYIAATVIAIPRFSAPGRPSNLNITMGSVSFEPKAKKLAAPNSPIETMALNVMARVKLFLRSGNSIIRMV